MTKRITILGAGISGTGAALLASQQGFEVFVSDFGEINDNTITEFEKNGIAFEQGGHTADLILGSDEIIKSPGISPDIDLLQKARSKNIPVIDELEFAGRYAEKPVILISGTNGKTTTTLLTAHLLNRCGIKALAVGNVGSSLAHSIYNQEECDIYVVECSSFQLDGMNQFEADVSVLLNITPDHLNRYGDMASYAQSKNRIAHLLKPDGIFVFNSDDPLINASDISNGLHSVSLGDRTASSHVNGNQIEIKSIDGNLVIPVETLSLKGEHNLFNTIAALSAVLKFTTNSECLIDGLESFSAVEHRLEWIEKIGKVDFVNDSKATNVEAVQYALGSFENPLVWIAGGVDKGNDYSKISQQVKEKVHSLICLGIENKKLHEVFGNTVEHMTDSTNMEDAVNHAWNYANPDDVVLLSPACASFDLFNSYEDRGIQFREAVINLKNRVEKGVENA